MFQIVSYFFRFTFRNKFRFLCLPDFFLLFLKIQCKKKRKFLFRLLGSHSVKKILVLPPNSFRVPYFDPFY